MSDGPTGPDASPSQDRNRRDNRIIITGYDIIITGYDHNRL